MRWWLIRRLPTLRVPGTPNPGANGVAVTDEIAAALVEVCDGADATATIKDLAENVRDELGMK